MTTPLKLRHLILLTGLVFCLPTAILAQAEYTGTDIPGNAEESIEISINNQQVIFSFFKTDSTWSGVIRAYGLNAEGEKVLNAHLVSAEDSTWNEFQLFVDHLDLYTLPDQKDIKNRTEPGQQAQRTYTFRVFDGEQTRSYTYRDPQIMLGDYWQQQRVYTFLTYIENDLRWRPVTQASE